MKQLLLAVGVAVAVPLLGGCAAVDDKVSAKNEPRSYVTGSMIGRRADQPTGSQTLSLSGDQLRKGQARLPELILPPEGYRNAGN